MKALVCELCGSQDMIKQDGVYVCQHCNTKYTTEEAKKLMVEVQGTVKIDSSDKLENLYQIARRAKEEDNSENAAKYYDMILIEDPSSWEAQFYSVYYNAMQCRIIEIPNAIAKLANCLDNVLGLIKSEVEDESKQFEAIHEIIEKCLHSARLFLNGSWTSYDPNGYYNNRAYFRQKDMEINHIFTFLNVGIVKHFGLDSEVGEKAVNETFKADIDFRVSQLYKRFFEEDKKVVENLIEEVKKKDPAYEAPVYPVELPASQQGGCYVATAVYGSYDCPQVWTLRRFRDYTLAETWYGRLFIKCYYSISPTLVKWFGETEWFKNLWKPVLDKIVCKLNGEGVENTPYNDRNW